ncbi:PKD domain-containing protein [Methyloterricola oryzae]|uniref:PKD domain-containing protein n=1 Tax=Methyloterricola oryzae TaxID=1495050 RepID=UPI000B05D146|nr:PKD domain-containing protein [Methyloterricola oryzae]
MNTVRTHPVAGLIALAAATPALATNLNDINALSGYHHLSNVNGVGATANSIGFNKQRIGLNPATTGTNVGNGTQYHHIFTNVDKAPGGTTGTITASEYAMMDPMMPGALHLDPNTGEATGFLYDASAYGVGQLSWCQQGECAGGAGTSTGWNHTSNHILFSVSQESSVTITLSNGPVVTGKHGPNEPNGVLGGDLKPAFTIYTGVSTTGVNDSNHTFNNQQNPWTNVTYLDHDANDGNASSITWNSVSDGPGPLVPGYYSLWIGGNYANVANADGSHGKNYRLTITASSPSAAPVANAGADQSVRQGAQVTLDGSASFNPDGKALSYQWTQISGSPSVSLSSATGVKPTFNAPNVSSSTVLTFRLVVRDTADNQTSDPAVVNITVGPNQAPVADAGSAGNIRAGATRTLDGSGSYDPDDDSLTFLWTQVSGPSVTLSDATAGKPSFVAPSDALGQSLVFSLRVSDGSLQSSNSATVSTTVVENAAPVLAASASPAVTEGSNVTLTVAGSDPDGDVLSYQWQQTSGTPVDLRGADSASASFTAPHVGPGGESLAFTVTVTDNYAPNPATTKADASITVTDDASRLDCSQAAPSRTSLWPPKKGLVKVDVTGVTGPDPYALTITGINQDEPVKDKVAKDKTGPDAKILKQRKTKKNAFPQDKALVRAERQNEGDGRVYAIAFSANDGSQTCTGSVAVGVPITASGTATAGASSYNSTKKK